MNCKIIATCFGSNRTPRQSSLDEHQKPRSIFPDHHQDITDPEEYLELNKKIVALELAHEDMPFDVIIVNSDTGYKEGNDYLDSINGTKTKNGTIYTMHRENRGWSFGAYSDAFKKFPNYDFYLFTEDDIIVNGDMYYLKLYERFQEEEFAGFVSLIGVAASMQRPKHCHGGVGFTSKDVLDKIVTRNGSLPHYDRAFSDKEDPHAYKQEVIRYGEVPFTNEIWKLGRRLVSYGEPGWNMEKNLCLPYYNYMNYEKSK